MPDDTSPSWIRSARNVLGIVVGCVSFPVLVTLGHGLFASAGVSQAPTVSPQEAPEVWQAFMESLTMLELLSASAAHWGGTFLAAALATLISASHKPTSRWVLGGFGLLGGAMNAFMLPGHPTWLMVLDVDFYLPMGWLGAMRVLRLKGQTA